jgi:hypothetical protein
MPSKISVIIPIIRPDKARRCIDTLLVDTTFQDFELVTEKDSKRIGCPKMVKRLTGQSQYELVCFLGDDTIPQAGMLYHALSDMESLPDGWGLVGIHDGLRRGFNTTLPTHWLAHKKLLPFLDNEFFHTGYYHCFCDNELQDRCEDLGRYRMSETARLIHDHPVNNRTPTDPDYRRVYGSANYIHDLLLYRKRKAHGWTTPPS